MINEKITASIDLINSDLKQILIHDKIIEFNHLDDANNFIKTGFIQVPLNTTIIADELDKNDFNFFINNFGSNFIKKFDIININVEFKQNENIKNVSYNNYIVTQVTIDNNEQIATIYFEDLFYLFKNTPIDFSINEANPVSIKEISEMMLELYTKKWKDFYGNKYIPIDFEYNFDLIISNMVVSNGSNMMQLIDLFDKEYLIKSYFDENKLVFGYNFINYYENDNDDNVINFSNATEEMINIYNFYFRKTEDIINIIIDYDIEKKLFIDKKRVVINVITTDGNLHTYSNNIESDNILTINVYSNEPEQFKKIIDNNNHIIKNNDTISITTFIYPKIKRYDIIRFITPFAEKNDKGFIITDDSSTYISNSVLTTYTNSNGLIQEIILGNKKNTTFDIEIGKSLIDVLNAQAKKTKTIKEEIKEKKLKLIDDYESKNNKDYIINEFRVKKINKNGGITVYSIPPKTLQTIENAAAKINKAGGVASTDELKIGRFVFIGKDNKRGFVQAVGNGKDEIVIYFDSTEKKVTSENLIEEFEKIKKEYR